MPVVLNRLRAFDDDGMALRAGMFFRAALHKGDDLANAWCAKNGVALLKAQGETAGTVGGYLVPTEVEAGIIKIRALAGTFRRNASAARGNARWRGICVSAQ